MEFVAVFALAAVVSILYNWAQPKFFAISSLQKYQSSYFGKTLLTTVVIFAAIVAAGLVFSAVDRKITV